MNGLNWRAFLTASAAMMLAGGPGRGQEAQLAVSARPPRRQPPSAKTLIERAGLGGSVAFAALDAASGQVMRLKTRISHCRQPVP